MANLFNRDKSVISRHIKTIFHTWELNKNQTVAKNATVQKEGKKEVTRQIEYYNLDMIISVGYRVNSKRGTQFRIWATKKLKDYLIQGYMLNQKRLSETGLKTFEKAIALVKKNIDNNTLTDQETKGMLSLVTNYAYSWIVLQKYDEWTLWLEYTHIKKTKALDYKEAITAITTMKDDLLSKKEVSQSFGVEKNDGLAWIFKQIYQTFDRKELYPSIEEKAAALLYFTIKNHPFVDGNKKIGAFLFVLFLAKNNHLYTKDWGKRIEDNTLVALTLLIATSEKSEKDMLLRLVANFLLDKKT